MSEGVWVLVTVLLVAAVAGVYRTRRDGRFRDVGTESRQPQRNEAEPTKTAEPTPALAGTEFEDRLGERATLLQFSSAFCAPCRATRRVLADVAQVVPGVTHVEVDAEQHLDLVRRVGVVRTPTTLVLDAAGHEVTRAGGAPSKEAVLASLARAVDPSAS